MPAVLGVVALVWQLATLPSMAPSGQTRLRTLVDVFRRSRIGLAMLSVLPVVAGQYAIFTYLRPFLENVTGVGVWGSPPSCWRSAWVGFAGSSRAGQLIERSMHLTLGLAPLAMSVLVAGLVLVGSDPLATTALVALWGFAGATVPVGWQAWIGRTVPDEAEVGGGLLVAAIQLAMSVGAAAGGLVFDASVPLVMFATSSAVMLAGAIVIFAGLRSQPLRSVGVEAGGVQEHASV